MGKKGENPSKSTLYESARTDDVSRIPIPLEYLRVGAFR